MNYRHAYHAGNHGDVLKHIVLARVLEHLKKKPKPFVAIDAHAGVGLYDLGGVEAGKTGEWQGGAAKLAEPLDGEAEALIAPYRQVLRDLNPQGGVRLYPGSPELALRLMRAGDRLIANELHPADAMALERQYATEPRADITSVDAETCLKSRLPPTERRGVVLIDPPYEVKDEAERVLRMLRHGVRRFAQGVFIVWYPLKADDTARSIVDGVRDLGVPASFRVEVSVRAAFAAGGLAGSGVIILNTPWMLDRDLDVIAPALAARLGLGDWGRASTGWLVPPV